MIVKHHCALLVLGVATSFSLFAQEPAKNGLTVPEFEKLHKELQPPNDELWRTIPWHVSIVEAQHAAAKSGKPIFVSVASGEGADRFANSSACTSRPCKSSFSLARAQQGYPSANNYR